MYSENLRNNFLKFEWLYSHLLSLFLGAFTDFCTERSMSTSMLLQSTGLVCTGDDVKVICP